METFFINVPEDIRNIVQKYDLEKQSRQEIIIYILQHNVNISKERFKQYEKEYKEKFISFEILKELLENTFIFPNIHNKKLISWNFNYYISKIEVKVKEYNA